MCVTLIITHIINGSVTVTVIVIPAEREAARVGAVQGHTPQSQSRFFKSDYNNTNIGI